MNREQIRRLLDTGRPYSGIINSVVMFALRISSLRRKRGIKIPVILGKDNEVNYIEFYDYIEKIFSLLIMDEEVLIPAHFRDEGMTRIKG